MVTIVNGAARISNVGFVGDTVGDVIDNISVSELLALDSGLSFTVTDADGQVVSENNKDQVLREGYTVRFTRASGTKG